MGVGAGLYMYDVVVKSSHSLFHLLMSSCRLNECEQHGHRRFSHYALICHLRDEKDL